VAGRGTISISALLATLLTLCLLGSPATAQTAVEIRPLDRDSGRQVDRYQITLLRGSTLWEVANNFLPLTALDQGDARAFEIVAESFQRAFPGRSPNAVQPNDSFVLEVPSETFVTQQVTRDGGSVVFTSFQGDQLTYLPRNPAIQYRLVRKDNPDRAEVSLTGQGGSAVDLAREIFQVDPPDFLQLRMVRGALSDRESKVLVDLSKKYLDDFRNYREQAVEVADGEDGLKVYTFSPAQEDIPFVRVEDGIGDSNDPGTFPPVFRLAYYRDGSVRKYILTESGDTVAQFTRPDPARWQKVLPSVSSWEPGTPDAVAPFTPAINQAGSLIPGRLLVVTFTPTRPTPSPAPRSGANSPPAGAGLSCFGIPLVVLSGLGLTSWGIASRRRQTLG
jgi:hypothetical protein